MARVAWRAHGASSVPGKHSTEHTEASSAPWCRALYCFPPKLSHKHCTVRSEARRVCKIHISSSELITKTEGWGVQRLEECAGWPDPPEERTGAAALPNVLQPARQLGQPPSGLAPRLPCPAAPALWLPSCLPGRACRHEAVHDNEFGCQTPGCRHGFLQPAARKNCIGKLAVALLQPFPAVPAL